MMEYVWLIKISGVCERVKKKKKRKAVATLTNEREDELFAGEENKKADPPESPFIYF